MFGLVAHGLLVGLAQLLVALVGAVLISLAVQGFRAEWQALFKKPFGSGVTRVLVYSLSAVFQMFNGYMHGVPAWEIPVLALLTALAATGIYHFAKKRWAA